MMAVKDHLTQAGLARAQAAKQLGVTQPRVSDLLRGKIHLFSLNTLFNLAASAGLHIDLPLHHAA
jgi:predicted XRE-type DNA-binding protein